MGGEKMDWVAFNAITNFILVFALVCVTIYYAMQTKKQADSMQKQATWDRTFRPRLDAYTRFMDAQLRRPLDAPAQRGVIAQLEFIQPYSSTDVRTIAHELFEYAEDFRRNNQGNIPHDIIGRINTELRPIIIEEIEAMTNEEP
jgi:hypothetical protein